MGAKGENSEMSKSALKSVSEMWPKAAKLAARDGRFLPALEALDRYYEGGRGSAAMMSLWGGMELIFCTSAPELKFRVSAFMAAFLENPGATRHAKFKQIKKLYDSRSKCAHNGIDPSPEELTQSYLLFRGAMYRIIMTEAIPTENVLLKMLFGETVTYADFK